MADVQLLDLRNRGDRPDVRRREAVSGVHRQIQATRRARDAVTERVERGARAGRVRVAAGVQLDGVGTQLARPGNAVRGPDR